MIAQAVWTGLAALLSALAGTSLAVFHGSRPVVMQWMPTLVFGLAIAAVPVAAIHRKGAAATEWRGSLKSSLGAASALAVSLVAMGLLWYRGAPWYLAVIGVAGTLGVAAACCLAGPLLGWPPARVGGASTLVLIVLALIVSYLGAGGQPGRFPWLTIPAVILIAGPLSLSLYPDLVESGRPGRESRADRLVSVAMFASTAAGIVAAVALFPGSWEIRLLAVSPGVVVTASAAVSLIHPEASSGRYLAGLLVKIGFCATALTVTLVYALV